MTFDDPPFEIFLSEVILGEPQRIGVGHTEFSVPVQFNARTGESENVVQAFLERKRAGTK